MDNDIFVATKSVVFVWRSPQYFPCLFAEYLLNLGIYLIRYYYWLFPHTPQVGLARGTHYQSYNINSVPFVKPNHLGTILYECSVAKYVWSDLLSSCDHHPPENGIEWSEVTCIRDTDMGIWFRKYNCSRWSFFSCILSHPPLISDDDLHRSFIITRWLMGLYLLYGTRSCKRERRNSPREGNRESLGDPQSKNCWPYDHNFQSRQTTTFRKSLANSPDELSYTSAELHFYLYIVHPQSSSFIPPTSIIQ